MNDMVSIVVPIYNVEKYLDRCIESIAKQTYKNLEIILVDDGSADNCPAICDEWAKKDSRIKVIHKSNAGLGEARNTGIQTATGKFIFFFDSDDYVAINAVEICLETAWKNNADTVVYGRNNVSSDGTISGRTHQRDHRKYEGEKIKKEFLPGLFDYSVGFGVSAWSKMFDLRIIKDNRLKFESERMVISEDAMFCLEYFSISQNVAVISDRLYYYVRNEKSLTRTYKEDRQMKNDEFLIKSIDRAEELGVGEWVSDHIAARYHGMTLGTIMQIVEAELPAKVKRTTIRSIYRNEVLRSTLKWPVISLDAKLPRVFWLFLKLRCYMICDFLLMCNRHKYKRER